MCFLYSQRNHCCCCLVTKLSLTLLGPHGLRPTRLLCPWDFPGKTTGVGCYFLLQGIFLTRGWNSHLPHWRVDSFTTESPEKTITEDKSTSSLHNLFTYLGSPPLTPLYPIPSNLEITVCRDRSACDNEHLQSLNYFRCVPPVLYLQLSTIRVTLKDLRRVLCKREDQGKTQG